MQIIQRDECVITGEKDLEQLYTLRNFPVHMLSDKATSIEDDLILDMEFEISKTSGMIQIKQLVPEEVLYKDSHFNAVGDTWRRFHKEFAKLIYSIRPKKIFEIGGSNGRLHECYEDAKYDYFEWTIMEPNPNLLDNCKAKIIKGFFPQDFDKNYNYDVFIHANVLEHIYKPDIFLKYISTFLNEGQYMIFAVPNFQRMLEKKYISIMNFEHTYLITEKFIDYLLSRNSLNIVKKVYFEDTSTVFYITTKDVNVKARELEGNIYYEYKKLFLEYIDYYKKIINKWNKCLETIKEPVYLFGAHISTQFLISFGLKIDNIVCILDNDEYKMNKRVSGTNFLVESPKILSKVKNPIVILCNSPYSEEIKNDILRNINSNTKFLE